MKIDEHRRINQEKTGSNRLVAIKHPQEDDIILTIQYHTKQPKILNQIIPQTRNPIQNISYY